MYVVYISPNNTESALKKLVVLPSRATNFFYLLNRYSINSNGQFLAYKILSNFINLSSIFY